MASRSTWACLLAAASLLCAACDTFSQSRAPAAPSAAAVPSSTAETAQPGVATSSPSAPTSATPIPPPPTVAPTATPARTGPLASCQLGVGAYAVKLPTAIRAAQYTLTIEIIDYHGPGTYPIPPERVSLRGDVSGTPLIVARSGSVRVDQGEQSGSIDAGVTESDVSRVQSSWSCA